MLEINPTSIASDRFINIDELPAIDPFFELSADLLCIAGFDGYFKRINPAVSKLLGYTEEELFARPVNDFVYHEDKDITQRNRENLTRNIPLLNFENRYVKKNGDLVWLSWTSMPMYGRELVYAIAKDVTHKKNQEEERNKLIKDLSRVNNDLKQLNYTTSHDLRTPVNNLRAIFDLMDVSKIEDEETLEYIDILKLSTDNLKETLDKYVDVLSQRDSMQAGVQELNISAVVDTVLLSLRTLIYNSGATIDIDTNEAPVLKFNKAYLESIFLNLISNSIKYARPDAAPEISLVAKRVNDFIQIIYRDNGQGFDMDKVKNKVFGLNQKFHQHTDSKGIGLYLVYNHIHSLGGNIMLDSRPNEGATFIMSFRD